MTWSRSSGSRAAWVAANKALQDAYNLPAGNAEINSAEAAESRAWSAWRRDVLLAERAR